MLIKGKDLTPRQVEEVLTVFIYRWTTGNPHRERVWAGQPSKPTMPLVTDAEWVDSLAFHFLKDGSRLMQNRRVTAVPVYMADNL